MKVGYICNGCGKQYWLASKDDPPPSGWLLPPRDSVRFWITSGSAWDAGPWCMPVACSADCVEAAKRNQAQKADEALTRFKTRLAAVRLERVK